MAYEIRQTETGWELRKLRPVLIGTFPEAATAELVRDLLAEADEDDAPPAPPAPPPARIQLLVRTGDPEPVATFTSPAPPEPDSWEALHAAGLTAAEAAERRGVTRNAAYGWAKKAGVTWTPPPAFEPEPERAPPPAPLPSSAPAPAAPRPAGDLRGWTAEEIEEALNRIEAGEKTSVVADDYRKPAHVLTAALSRRLAAKREAAGRFGGLLVPARLTFIAAPLLVAAHMIFERWPL